MLIWIKGKGIETVKRYGYNICIANNIDRVVLRLFYKKNEEDEMKYMYVYCQKDINKKTVTVKRLKFTKDMKDEKDKKLSVMVALEKGCYEAVIKKEVKEIPSSIKLYWVQHGDILDTYKEETKYKDYDYSYILDRMK